MNDSFSVSNSFLDQVQKTKCLKMLLWPFSEGPAGQVGWRWGPTSR